MLEKRSVTLSGHRTSVALEPEFWAVLERAASEMDTSIAGLIKRIDEARGKAGFDRPLASSLRVWALQRNQALADA
ncbi:MAG: ribbon-helix-helix domain-containing protein [Pseudomonadota bacterium]